MNTFSKMVMVPQQAMMDPLRYQEPAAPLLHQLATLDQQMRTILDDNIMSPEEKMQKYTHTLHRYQGLRSRQLEPYTPAVHIPKLPEDEIMDSIPKQSKNKAKILIQHLKKHPEIKWTDDGHFMVNGNPVEGSNLVDLVHDYTRKISSKVKVPGSQEFRRRLQETNVPQMAMGNHERDDAHTSSNISLAVPASSFGSPVASTSRMSTPRRSNRKQKQTQRYGDFEEYDWEPY